MLVMYAGAIAVPLIVGRAPKLELADVAYLISADLFVCGIVNLIQSLGATQWFAVRLPVMMGVTFSAVGPMVAVANTSGGPDGACAIFGAIIAAGIIAMLIAPLVSRLLRFFPPVVTGTIILVIGITLMRIGINWIFGNPAGPTSLQVIDPAHADWLKAITDGVAAGTITGVPELPGSLTLAPKMNNPLYTSPMNITVSAIILTSILLIARFAKGFVANISVLLGIVIGAVIAVALGAMTFGKVAGVDFARNRNNLFIVAGVIGFGMIPLIAPNFKMWMPQDIHPLIESGILLASLAAVVLNAFFNGATASADDLNSAASSADH